MTGVILIDGIIKALFMLVLITAAFVITRRDVLGLFSAYAMQSFFLAMMASLLYLKERNVILLLVAVLTLTTKVVLIPVVMRYLQKRMSIKRDIEFHYISPTGSLLASVMLFLFVYLAFSRALGELDLGPLFFLGAVMGVSLALIGMLVMFSRKKAITKIVGYLTMENGVLLFGLFVADLPFMIEVLVVIDLFMIIVLAAMLAFGIDSSLEEFHGRINVFRSLFRGDDR